MTTEDADSSSGTDVLSEMLKRRQDRIASVRLPDPDPEDENPPFDSLTENMAYHMRRWNKMVEPKKAKAVRSEASVLASIKNWLKKIEGMDVKRVSVGKMRNQAGFMMNFGGVVGESDLILTPHAGQPFERQIHVEVKRPEIRVDGKIVQTGGKQSDNQKKYQADMEARGDRYYVVTSVDELRITLEGLGFTGLPKVPKGR